MKIVMVYTYTDGCTYSCQNTIPIEYDSPEAALCDFIEKAYSDNFNIFGIDFYKYDFIEGDEFYPPEFYSLEEWFDKFKST